MAWLAYFIGQGGFAMYPLFACLGALVGLVLERVIMLGVDRGPTGSLTGELERWLRMGDLERALFVAASTPGAVARIATRILREGLGPEARADGARHEALTCEEPRVVRNRRWFGWIAQLATLFGLLGTITGIGGVGFGYHDADATSKAVMLAKAVSESLACTAGGLFVTILALVAHLVIGNWMDARLAALRAEAKAIANLLVVHRARLRLHGARPYVEPMGYRRAA